MSFIGQVTLINQNMHIPAVIYADNIAREHFSKEVQKIINEEKELELKRIRPVEEVEPILSDEDAREEVDREVKHLDIKA